MDRRRKKHNNARSVGKSFAILLRRLLGFWLSRTFTVVVAVHRVFMGRSGFLCDPDMPWHKAITTSVAAKQFSYEYGHATASFSQRKQPLSEDLGHRLNRAVVVRLSCCYLPAMRLNILGICRHHSISHERLSVQASCLQPHLHRNLTI